VQQQTTADNSRQRQITAVQRRTTADNGRQRQTATIHHQLTGRDQQIIPAKSRSAEARRIGQGFRDSGVRGTSDKGRQRQITAVERQIRTAQQQTTADNSGQPQTTAVRRRITAVERQITTGQQQITAENSGQRQTTAVRRRITAGQRQIAAINGRQNQTMSPGKEGSPIQSVESSGLRRAPSLENSATITPAAAGRRNYGAPESRWEGFEVTGVLVTKGRGAPAQRPAGSESPVTTASDRQTDQPQHTGKVSVNSANANRDGQQSAPAVRPNGSEADASRDDANRPSRRESQGDGRGSIEKLNTVLRTTSITAEDAGQRQITAVQRQITGEQQQLTPIQQQTISAKGRGAKARRATATDANTAADNIG